MTMISHQKENTNKEKRSLGLLIVLLFLKKPNRNSGFVKCKNELKRKFKSTIQQLIFTGSRKKPINLKEGKVR